MAFWQVRDGTLDLRYLDVSGIEGDWGGVRVSDFERVSKVPHFVSFTSRKGVPHGRLLGSGLSKQNSLKNETKSSKLVTHETKSVCFRQFCLLWRVWTFTTIRSMW